MTFLKKLNQDGLKNSIVEVKFNSSLPFEIYIGQIFKTLDDTYKYTNRSSEVQKNIQLPLSFEVPHELRLNFGSPFTLFFNEKIKFEIQTGSIIFNCIDKYIGWDLYFPEIEKVLNQIHTSNCIKFYNRVGIRYVSEYPETEISSITKFGFTFDMPGVTSENYSFLTEYKKDNFRVILNLNNKISAPNLENQQKKISLIDIDVISENSEIANLNSLFELIKQTHAIEKIIFFNLLKEEFLESLNPQY